MGICARARWLPLLLLCSLLGSVQAVRVELVSELAQRVGTAGLKHASQASTPEPAAAKPDLEVPTCSEPYPVAPVSFSFPLEWMVQPATIHKERVVAFTVPGRKETYIHKEQAAYYRGYNIALFGLTWKKEGWDCMRHYEILASGALPYMPDVGQLPKGTMFRMPRQLMEAVLTLPGVNHTAIQAGQLTHDAALINDEFDLALYERLLQQMLDHARSYLTTQSMAEYMLSAAGVDVEAPVKVLFLAHDHTDFLAETIYHGLRSLLGAQVVDVPKRGWMYRRASQQEEDEARKTLYGKGFSYAFTLPDLDVDRNNVPERISAHEFDLIVYGITHFTNEDWMYHLDLVKQVYSSDEVLFLDGSDYGARAMDKTFSGLCGVHGKCFRREFSCPIAVQHRRI